MGSGRTRAGPRRWALRARAGMAMGLTSLVLAAGLATLAYSLLRSSLIEEHESAAMRQAYTNARVVRSALRAADPDLADLLSGLQVGPEGGAVLVTRTETFTSSVAVSGTDVPRSLATAVAGGRAGHQRVIAEGPYLVVGVPIAAAGAGYYEVTSFAEVERTLDLLASSLAIAAVTATALGATVGLAVSGAVLRPLRRVAGVARRIVDGDLDTRLDAEADRDLAPLADAFNEMLDDLRERIRREARFASDVTHELRGPLTVLSAAVNIVDRRRPELPPEVSQALDALHDQVTSFNQLVLDLLEISRFEAGTATLDTRPVDMADLVRSVVSERPAPRPDVVVAAGTDTRAVVDARRAQQVLANLLDNAGNYAGGATAVTIDRRNGRLRVGVEDNGPGIAPTERERVFDRFARGSAGESPEAPRGSGLGLALCADHVRLHGGELWVEESPSGGARFVIELPGAS